MNLTWLKTYWNKWLLLAALIVLFVLCFLWWLLFWVLQPLQPASLASTAVLTVIPPPTITPTLGATLTPTPPEEGAGGNDIAVGVYVQIFDTGRDGLRLRSGPGTSYEVNFIGLDEEVFLVKDGPKEADGHTWWYLVAPYDANRSGWAASRYLEVVSRSP